MGRVLLGALVALLLVACGGSHGSTTDSRVAVELSVPSANRAPPFDLTRRLMLPPGWSAEVWARVDGARLAVWTPEHDLLVSRPLAGSVVRLEPRTDGALPPRASVLVSGLNEPQGLAFDTLDGRPVLYVAESSRLLRYAWDGAHGLGARTVVTRSLPDPDGIDRLKGIAVGPDHTVYVGVGSMSLLRGARAVVLAFRPGGARLTFATGVRNGVGLAFDPDGGLWTAANAGAGAPYPFHRPFAGFADAYGKVIRGYDDTHPPDVVARLSAGRNLGWPYCNPNPDGGGGLRYERLPFVADVRTNPGGAKLDCATLAPLERALPAHSAPLGFAFLHATAVADPWRDGAVIAVHGSFDPPTLRAPAVLWLPWTDRTLGAAQPLVTGFQLRGGTRWGRPVDAVAGPDGALYVTDDLAGAVYRLVPRR